MGLDTIELVMTLEEDFKFNIPNEDAESIETVGELAEYISRAASTTGSDVSYQVALNRISFLLTRDYGVDATDITDASRFVKDLGLD